MQSSLSSVIKMEENRGHHQHTMSETSSTIYKQKFDYRDRQGNDIFNFSNVQDNLAA